MQGLCGDRGDLASVTSTGSAAQLKDGAFKWKSPPVPPSDSSATHTRVPLHQASFRPTNVPALSGPGLSVCPPLHLVHTSPLYLGEVISQAPAELAFLLEIFPSLPATSLSEGTLPWSVPAPILPFQHSPRMVLPACGSVACVPQEHGVLCLSISRFVPRAQHIIGTQ